MMESPAESPMEQDDAAYPCKGCGEVHFPCLQLMPRHGSAPIADDLSFYVDTGGGKGLRIGYVTHYGFTAMPLY